jgi:hypothetical protein
MFYFIFTDNVKNKARGQTGLNENQKALFPVALIYVLALFMYLWLLPML